ncbi:interferon-induced very large GTPase 1-like [Lytechinus pictus]|uniref:interferon-induced very large GTPase 1-like n=1 Tax=Lytechinus pictus TaxID=7653 RepID=UPI0030B9C4B2
MPFAAPDTVSELNEQKDGFNAELYASMDVLHKREIRNHLRDIVELRHKGTYSTDETMISKLDQLRQLMNVPKEKWIEHYDDEIIDDMITNMLSDIKHLEQLVEGKPKNSAAEILENASGGLALRGILVGEAYHDDCMKCVVLSTPTDIKLMNPTMKQIDGAVHFSSKAQSDHFHQSLDTMGYSVACLVKDGGWGFKAEASFSKMFEKADEKESESYERTHFESSVKYSVIPTAACELNPHSLKLSSQALDELKTIDKLLVGDKNPDLVYEKCEGFLKAYGSHINAGILHFGGVYHIAATCTSESKSEEVKNMVRGALSAYASASYFGFGASMDANNIKPTDNLTDIHDESDQAETTLHTTRIGGPQEVSAFPLWKIGLVTCSNTWALIDRGKSLFTDLVGIWKLIPNHKDDFLEPDELESSLMTVWMSSFLGSSDQGRTFVESFDEIDLLVDRIGKWNSNPIRPEKCIEYLQDVLKTVEQVEAQTNTTKYWDDKLCTGVNISNFFRKIMELTKNLDSKDVFMVQYLIAKLVSVVGPREFPEKHKINAWLQVITKTVKIQPILANVIVQSIPDLLQNLNERFIPSFQSEHARKEELNVYVFDCINAGATVELSICVGQLLNNLQASGEAHEMFFLKIALLSLQYHWPTKRFKTPIVVTKLREFVQSTEVLWKEFQVKKEKGIIQLEAFLIQTLLTSGQFDEGNNSSEDELSEITRDIRQVLSPELNKVMNDYATHSPYQWVEILTTTAELANGNMASSKEKEMDIGDLKSILGSQDRNSQLDRSRKITNSDLPAQENFSDILNTLGLDMYYPSKITLLDVTVIKKATGPLKLVDLPWRIIHKILMIDFHARDEFLPMVSKSRKQEISNASNEGGQLDFEAILRKVKDTSDGGGKIKHLNTLDVLVATFTCCDNFLKQTLAQKMFVCKLAIPFLYPLRSEGIMGMSLWALRAITVQWQTNENVVSEASVTEKPFPLVTFVRLGRPPLSKSKLVNDIIRDESHDTFFHHDCNSGTIPRRITDGLVECSWFISGGKEKEHLPATTMLLNLRGDGSLMIKQMQILQEISSVMLVMATAKDLARAPNTNTCQQILKSRCNVILFVISEYNKQGKQELSKELRAGFKAVGHGLLKGVPIILSSTFQGSKKNASELKTEIRVELSELIAGCSAISIEKYARRAKEFGVMIDEYDGEACLKGKRFAENVVKHLKGIDIADCKRLLLPLQGAEWIDYCKLVKMHHRTSGKGSQSSSEYHADRMKQKIDLLREKQVEICHNRLSPFITDFMSTLNEDREIVMYFLKWMTILFDEKSRTYLPGLRRRYHEVWLEFQVAKKIQRNGDLQDLKQKVDLVENQLARASLGVENLFRELGQIYEAMKSSKIGKNTKAVVENLPEIAANLLLIGIPLELVDGDASSVPIEWVSAVLCKLENIIGEKKLFVIAVLGIQSSGKSTLLNTMFGLQFAVSAGRCTRGAYMQLIPVEEDAYLPFSYVVVIDTEGLRSPELEQLNYDHDNELATLVIGLGDVTMINIKGENTTEIKDILQIAVHASLRRNLVRKHIRDHATCIFVHQNVPAANAEELMMHGCQRLQEDLDDITKEAALSESIANVNSFSQIISFDVQNHVWYFSDLWHGDPPMAPANPGYSEKVDAVRFNLLGEIAEGQKTFLTTSDLAIRLNDLWNGVLADDFVFSFRNSLEVKVYNGLQSKYYTLEWDMQNKMKYWLLTAETKLKMCVTVNDLESSFVSLKGELLRVLSEKAMEIEFRLRDYFEESNLQGIVIQWQHSKFNQFDSAVQQQQYESKADLLSIKEARRVEILQTQKWSEHEAYIMDKAVELADKLKGNEASNNELEKRFDIMWRLMVRELAAETEDTKLQMDIVMEEILRIRFFSHRAVLKLELKQSPLSSSLEQMSLENSITYGDISNEHICLKATRWENGKNLVGFGDNLRAAKQMTVVLTNRIFKEIDTYLKGLSNQDVKFQKGHATEVIQKLVTEIDAYNQEALMSKNYNFTILPDYVVKLAVHVSRHCVQVFSLMQSEYNSKYGVKAKIQDYKNTAFSLFKNQVKQSTEEVVAGDLLCTHLMKVVEEAVKKAIPRQCVDEVLRDFQMSKYHLMVKIMEDLAVKANFKEYESFINNAEAFAFRWITEYTNEKMFTRKDGDDMSRYAQLAACHIKNIIKCITKSVKYATAEVEGGKGMRMPMWIEKFCHKLSARIAVPVSTLNCVSARPIVDFKNMQRVILDKLDEQENNLMCSFANETANTIAWDGKPPPQQILDKIWGCTEKCPFCGEPCADTTPDHYSLYKRSHTCVQHRPKGIKGIFWRSDSIRDGIIVYKKQLNHESCNYSVQQKELEFSCHACNFKCRKYGKCTTTGTNWVSHNNTEYKTYLQDWDIAPDPTNSVSKYWMWFMATYQHQLRDMYNVRLPSIPVSWRTITKQEALTDLRKIHH